MIACRADRRMSRSLLGLTLTCFTAAALAVPGALAQGQGDPDDQAPTAFNQPLNLLPGAGDNPEVADPLTTTAEPLTGGPRLQPIEPEPTRPSSDIEVNPLDSIDLEAVGTLDQGNGGFGSNMWNGSKRHVVTRLLARLPDRITSPSLRALARRLLLSAAIPPQGAAGQGESLLRLRVERLAALGEIESLEQLLRVVPERNTDETIQRARVEAHLVAGNADAACASVRRVVSQGQQTIYWQKALVFCQIHAGEMAGAALGVGLLREQSAGDEDNFIALAEAASSGGSDIPAIGDPSVFELSMLQRLEAPLADGTLDEDHPGMLFAMSRSESLTLDRRIEVAERAVALGVLPTEDLAGLYRKFEIAAEDLAAFRIRAVEWQGIQARALRFQAAEASSATAKDKADMIQAALDAAEAPAELLGVARLYEPMLLQIVPAPDLAWFSGTAGQALFALGRFQKAEAWMSFARQEAMTKPAAAGAVTSLWPYARLAGLASVPWDGDLNTWTSANRSEDPAALGQRLALLQIALRALGGGGPLDWSEIAATAQDNATEVPDATVLFALDGSSGSGRLGETVLLSLLVLGEAGPGGSHLLALERVLTALTNVGLEREARVLAIEAALARGV